MGTSILNQQIILVPQSVGCRQCALIKSSEDINKYVYDENGKIIQTLPLSQDLLIEKCKAVHRQ